MDAKKWEKMIKKHCEMAETMRDEFVPVIHSLAVILEERDRAYEQYVAEGAQPVIIRTSDRGAENPAKNPLLVTWMDLNAQALTYWRDLGLTPAGLKRINENGLTKKKKNPLVEALKDL